MRQAILARMAGERTKTTSSTQRARGKLLRRDVEVERLLAELAIVLLEAGLTPKRFAELAKHAFVKAAGTISRFRNGKINHSRVAVMTGLSRIEVKRILSSSLSATAQRPIQQSRGERVIAGWMSNPGFQDANGLPRRLSIVGARGSFGSLVRRFGGDVPPHAVLRELRRLRVVRQIGDQLELDVRKQFPNGRAAASLSSLIPVVIDGIRLAGKTAN
jgi:hypothetical protein